MIKSIHLFKVGEHGEVPACEIYWMSDFFKWARLSFYSFLFDSTDGYILMNTGLVRDLDVSNKFLREWAGSDRCKFSVKDGERIEQHLKRINLTPEDISRLIVTPVQDYTVGNLDIFHNARIYFSRRGWHEDVVNPKPPPFVVRELILPKYIREYLFEDAWNRIELVENQEIVDGLGVRWTGGHHRSSMAVVARLKDKVVGITDSAFTQRNIQENIPIGIAENIHECMEAYDYLRRTCDIVIPEYDPENIARYGDTIT
jgi:glyoxylase-like metal-dependent hydrolase (beta-lactamase superfamily II)